MSVVDARRRVALIGILHGDGDNGTSLQIHCVLSFVRQVCPPVLHLRDFCVGIERMGPVVIRPLLRSLPIETRQILSRGRVDAGCLRELHQELLIRCAGVAAHDTAQRRVRFQRRGVNPDGFAFDQTRASQPLQNPCEDGFVRFDIDQATGSRNRRMIRRRVWQHQPKKIAERKGIRGAPRDGAFGVQAFEVADQQQSKVAAGRQPGSANLVGVESLAA